MRLRVAHAAVLLACAFLAASGAVAEDSDVIDYRLDNGLTLLVSQRSGVPLACCRLVYRAGSVFDPPGKEGLADFVRRLTFHGTGDLGSADPQAEIHLRAELKKTTALRDRQFELLPADMVRKLNTLPRKIEAARNLVRTRLKSLAGGNLPPMSREEMVSTLDFVRDRERHIRRMMAEIKRVKKSAHYRKFQVLRVLEEKIEKNTERLLAIVTPDPIRRAYRRGGAIRFASRTGPDATVFSAALPANRVELFLWVESRRMTGAVFRQFEEEKNLVLRSFSDAPPSFSPLLRRVTFADHPYARPVRGTRASAETFSPDDATSFYKAHYRPDRAALVVVGDVDPDRIYFLASRYFGPAEASEQVLPAPAAPPPTGPLHMTRFASPPCVELRYVLPGASDEDWPAIQCFARALPHRARFQEAVLGPGLAEHLDVSLETGALGSVMTVRAFPSPGASLFRLAAALKEAVRIAAILPLGDTAFQAARASWKAETADRLGAPGVEADALALGFARGAWRMAEAGALDGLEAEDVSGTAGRTVGAVQPVELWTLERKP